MRVVTLIKELNEELVAGRAGRPDYARLSSIP